MNKINNNKIALAIGSLSVITLMAIIYASFTGQLSINGTANVRDSVWNIHIVESGQLEPSNTLSSSAKVLTKPIASNLSISDFNLSLTTPGDYIEYTFHVVNEGDYDATLSDLDKDGPICTANGSTSDQEAVKVCDKLEYTLKYAGGADVAEGDTILSKETQTMVLKIKYQEFDDATLLPNTNVSISGLGIDISYSQSGTAKVNADGTTPYVPTYSVGDEIMVAGELYYVIEDSDSTQDYVTALKANPLTSLDIQKYSYNIEDVLIDTSEQIGKMAYDHNDRCRGSYYDENLHYNFSLDSSGCATDYNQSQIIQLLYNWQNDIFSGKFQDILKLHNNYKVRLVNDNDLIVLGYPTGEGSLNVSNKVPTWIYNGGYAYWTMSVGNVLQRFMRVVFEDGHVGSGTLTLTFSEYAVRPVINVYKSAISD